MTIALDPVVLWLLCALLSCAVGLAAFSYRLLLLQREHALEERDREWEQLDRERRLWEIATRDRPTPTLPNPNVGLSSGWPHKHSGSTTCRHFPALPPPTLPNPSEGVITGTPAVTRRAPPTPPLSRRHKTGAATYKGE